jgi:regulator of sigma E protease
MLEKSPARGKVKAGDVVEAVSTDKGTWPLSNPSASELKKRLGAAGQNGAPVQLTVRGPKDATSRVTDEVVPSVKVAEGQYGLGIQLGYDEQSTVVAEVMPDSPAAAAGIPREARITAINGQPVANWFQVRKALVAARQAEPIKVTAIVGKGESKDYTLIPTADSIRFAAGITFGSDLVLHEHIEVRKTSNPLVAAQWGVVETRDFILQFYLTLKRMVTGDISPRQAMGPVGIFVAGSKFAGKGTDWLIWFLAMISANLAVVNFLPIPIVDGGHFVFLVLEKIQGKPLPRNVQHIIQVVGLALILGVFLLVTVSDIARQLGHM